MDFSLTGIHVTVCVSVLNFIWANRANLMDLNYALFCLLFIKGNPIGTENVVLAALK